MQPLGLHLLEQLLGAPERVVAACVIAGFLAFEVWFFFLAGSSLPT